MTEFANFYPVILRVDGKSLEGKRRRFWNKVGVVVRDPFHFQPRNLWKILYEHLFISLPCSLKYLTNQMKSDERKWNMYNKKFEGRIDFTTLIRRNTKWNKSVSFEGKKSRWKINRFILKRVGGEQPASSPKFLFSARTHEPTHLLTDAIFQEGGSHYVERVISRASIHHRCNHCAKRDKPSTSKGGPFTPTRLRVHPPRELY